MVPSSSKKEICIPQAKSHRAPIMSLFFIWRLHGKPRHGYSLVQDMKEISISACKPSTVYALLTKLEASGLVKSHYDKSSAHARKRYSTTSKGWALLQTVKKLKIQGLWREFLTELLF